MPRDMGTRCEYGDRFPSTQGPCLNEGKYMFFIQTEDGKNHITVYCEQHARKAVGVLGGVFEKGSLGVLHWIEVPSRRTMDLTRRQA